MITFFIYFFLLLFVFLFVFDRLTRSYLNPYKLIMVFGKKGSGKTTLITKLALQHLKAGWNVYSTVSVPGVHLFDVNKIGDMTFPEESVIFIDEVGMVWDNRDFKNFKTSVRDYFKFQRQYRNKVYLFSQTFDIDLKLRNLTDEMYLLSNFCRVFSVVRRIRKNITIQKGSDGQASTLVDNYEFCSLFEPNSISFTFIPRYVPFFESYDPKKLPVIYSRYLEPTKYQKQLMSFKGYLLFSFFNKINGLKKKKKR